MNLKKKEIEKLKIGYNVQLKISNFYKKKKKC